MCGIAIILSDPSIELDGSSIDRMTAALHHRGPDASATHRLPGCHLGHTRLSVIDAVGGAQPMSDPTGRYTLVFNGEIYNFRELRRDLEQRGHHFRSRSDTEVLLAAYLEFGDQTPSRLNGQFAFAVWDTTTRRLFAARDRFGEKPIYWAQSPLGHVVIASEISAILASGLVSPRIDLLSVDAYLGLLYVPPDRTIYANVHTLPPAHAAAWTHAGRQQWRYWTPPLGTLKICPRDAAEQTRFLLERAVRRQTVADVPVGAFLSGGLDSTTIVALMCRAGAAPLRTFSVGFGDLIDELPFAREVASAYSTEHHELQMDIDVAAMLRRMAEVYDEPLADSSNIPTYLIAEYARKNVTVVLSGDGGDELFGGYAWYAPLLSDASDGRDMWERHIADSTRAAGDRAALWGAGRQPPTMDHLREHYRPGESVAGVDRAIQFDLDCYLPGDILTKVDRAAMAHGLETRSPFLDGELAEFVLSLPASCRLAGGTLKALLRSACGDLWPASIGARAKQGFGAPVRHWLLQPAVAEMERQVHRPNSALATLLPGAREAIEALRPQQRWTLLCLGLWLEGREGCLVGLR